MIVDLAKQIGLNHQQEVVAAKAEFSQRARVVVVVKVSPRRPIEFRLAKQSARWSMSVACLIQAEGKLTDFG